MFCRTVGPKWVDQAKRARKSFRGFKTSGSGCYGVDRRSRGLGVFAQEIVDRRLVRRWLHQRCQFLGVMSFVLMVKFTITNYCYLESMEASRLWLEDSDTETLLACIETFGLLRL